MNYRNVNSAFTLAEILVTLGVIGVIASMTVPTLVQDVQDAQWKAGYKKAFAVASQSWKMALSDNLIVARTVWTDSAANSANFIAFKSKFNVVKDCSNNNNADCWANGEKWDECPSADAWAFIDNSGMVWSRVNTGGSGRILVDINGSKGPNLFGRDRFVFEPVTENDSIDAGLPIKIKPRPDQITVDPNCRSGNCYYTSWLKE